MSVSAALAWYRRNRETILPKARERGNARYKEKKVEILAKAKARYHADPSKYADKELKRRFGIGLADYFLLLQNQGNACAICKSSTPGGRGRFHVDHCHTTGKIRGILCHSCNVGLGVFKDSPFLLFLASAYLRSHKSDVSSRNRLGSRAHLRYR